MSTHDSSTSPRTRQLRRLVPILLTLAVLAILWFGGRSLGTDVPRFAEWVDQKGPWGPVVFVLGYALAAVAFLPGSLFSLAAGALFGLAFGTLYAFLGALLGASLAFLVARYVARGAIERKIAGNARFAAIDRAVGKEGFKIVALLRLSPAFPFNLLNYALGLTRVPFLHYLAASCAMLPATLLYVYYGKAAGSLAAAAGGARLQGGPAGTALLIVGLVATLAVTAYVTRLAGRALRKEIGADPEPPAASTESRHV